MHGYTVETYVRVLSCDVCARDEKESIDSSLRSIFHRLLYTLYTSCIPCVYLPLTDTKTLPNPFLFGGGGVWI